MRFHYYKFQVEDLNALLPHVAQALALFRHLSRQPALDGYSDEYGKIGWVPKGAFPEFDGQVFQAKKGEIIGPINSSLGFVVLQVNETIKSTTINNELHELLVRRQADDWFTQKTADLISYIDFDKNDADWIVENLR